MGLVRPIRSADEIIERNRNNKNTYLDLSNYKLTEIPPKVFELTHIEVLKLGYWNKRDNKINEIPDGISNLKNLKKLLLDGNRIKTISPKILELSYLETLALDDNDLSEIPEIVFSLTSLKNLYVNDNPISTIDKRISNLINLTEIDFGRTNVEYIPNELLELNNLNAIQFFRAKLKYISKDIAFLPKLHIFYLRGNPIENIPKEIYETNNCLGNIRNYFKSIEEDENRQNDQVKMIVVGNSTAGKTSLLNYLVKNQFDEKQESTHGIAPLSWQASKNCKVHIWDFGGQDYYHNTHQLFFSNRCVYVVLFEEKTNCQGVVETEVNLYENGKKITKTLPFTHFSVSYWLENIHTLAKAENPHSDYAVLVVQNKIDLPNTKKQYIEGKYKTKEYGIEGEMHFLSVVKTFNGEGTYIDTFKVFKNELVNNLEKQRGDFLISEKWVAIKSELESRASVGKIVLNYKVYRGLCQEIKPTIDNKKEGEAESELDTLTNTYLKSTGTILYYPHIPALKNTVFINPNRVMSIIYEILDYKVKENNGKFDFNHVLKITQGIIHSEIVIALMREFELIFEDKDKPDNFIATQYLPEKCLNIQAYRFIKGGVKQKFVLNYPHFLSINVISRFIARFGNLASDGDIYWKSGIAFLKEETHILVECEFENRRIVVFMQENENSKKLSKEIFDNLLEISRQEESIEVSVDNQNFVSVRKLKKNFEKGIEEFEYKEDKFFKTTDFQFLLSVRDGMYRTTLEQIIGLVNEANISKAFEEIDRIDVRNPIISQLKQEFIYGNLRFDFYDRLKMAIKDELKTAYPFSPSN